MDTHITPDPPVIDRTPLRCVRLPGEPDVTGADGSEQLRSEQHFSRQTQIAGPATEAPVVSAPVHAEEELQRARAVEAAKTLKPLRADDRLPGERETGNEMTAEAFRAEGRVPEATTPTCKGTRYKLLAGIAVVALITASAGVFMLSPYNHVVPVPSQVRAAVRNLAHRAAWTKPPLVAPAASLAGVQLPAQRLSVVQPAFHPLPAPEQLAQVLHLGPQASGINGGTSAKPAPASGHLALGSAAGSSSQGLAPAAPAVPQAASGTPPGYVPHEPGAAPAALLRPAAEPGAKETGPGGEARVTPGKVLPPRDLATVASVTPPGAPPIAAPAAARPVGVQPVLSPPAHPSLAPSAVAPPEARPLDVTAVVARLQAAPLATVQQVQVLEVVNQIAAMVRDERTEVADVQVEVKRLSGGTNTKLLDFERRLAMLEAQTGIAAAAAAGRPPSVPPPLAAPPSDPPAPVSTASGASAASTAPASDSPIARVRYRLQAASPGLALLAEIDKGGGAGAQLQVSVGDTIPGYGRMISVAQQGAAWVVTTEHGTIR